MNAFILKHLTLMNILRKTEPLQKALDKVLSLDKRLGCSLFLSDWFFSFISKDGEDTFLVI